MNCRLPNRDEAGIRGQGQGIRDVVLKEAQYL